MEQQTVEQAQALRTVRAVEITKKKRITKRGPMWVVPSQSHSGSYVVTTDVVDGGPRWSCSCPDHESRQQPCKHIIAVEIVRHHAMPDGTTVTETLRVTYSQKWHAYNTAQVYEKERFALLLRDLCAGIGQPAQTLGRPRLLLRDTVFAAATKVFSTQSGRRAQTDMRSEAAKGLMAKAPSYNSIFRTIENPARHAHPRARVAGEAGAPQAGQGAPRAVVRHDDLQGMRRAVRVRKAVSRLSRSVA